MAHPPEPPRPALNSGLSCSANSVSMCDPDTRDDDEFRFNYASTHESHLRQNGVLTWYCNKRAIIIIRKKCKNRTNLKIKKSVLKT